MKILALIALLFAQSCAAQMILDGNMKTQGNQVFGNIATSRVISAWGDSLTAGGQDGFSDSYPYDLSVTLNRQTINNGDPGVGSTTIAALFLAAPQQWNNTSIIWSGRNDFSGESTILADIASMVAKLQSSRYLVMSILNSQLDTSGSTTYNEIIADNTALAGVYPSNYFDIRSFLVAQYNPANGADVANHTADLVPYTLRAIIQTGTLTAALTDTTSCPTLSVALTETYQIISVDSEYILEQTFSNGTVLTCTRGYGSTAATHSSGAAYTAADSIHLNAKGYSLVAQQVTQFIVNHSY